MTKRFELIARSAVLAFGAAWAAQGASLRIEQARLEPGGLAMEWSAQSAANAYVVRYRDQAADRIWRLPETLPLPLAEPRWTAPIASGTRSRFFQVMAVPAAVRGRLLSAQLAQTLSLFQITLMVNLAGLPVTPMYSVDAYQILYETVDPWGGKTVAGGAFFVPQGMDRAAPLLSYQHETIVEKDQAPSRLPADQLLIGAAVASLGYAVAMPDYLGLGDSPGFHPYHHARSEATACVDMLRACRALAAQENIPLNRQLFLVGYSQGGHATMALHRELETFHADEFAVAASAPCAGAYDLSGVTSEDFLSGRPMPNPYYFAYLLAAYQEVYSLTNSLADLLAPPYDATLPPLLDGRHSAGEINAAMPEDVRQILRPETLAAFESDPRHPLRLALEENDLYRWTPRAPMRLYHCSGDQDVIFANSQAAWRSFHDRGATQVELIDPLPGADHGGCVAPAILQVRSWFDSLRE